MHEVPPGMRYGPDTVFATIWLDIGDELFRTIICRVLNERSPRPACAAEPAHAGFVREDWKAWGAVQPTAFAPWCAPPRRETASAVRSIEDCEKHCVLSTEKWEAARGESSWAILELK